MPLNLVEGFRHIPGPYDKIAVYPSGNGGYFARVAGKTTGTYALRHTAADTSADLSNTAGTINIPITPTSNSWAVGFSVNLQKVAGSAGAKTAGIGVISSDNYNVYASISTAFPWAYSNQSDNYISGWTLKDTTVVSPGWHWACVCVNWKQASTGFVRLYRDSVLAAEMGPDTRTYFDGDAMNFRIYTGNAKGTSGMDVGDIVLFTEENGYIVEQRVDVIVPDGAYGTNQWVGSDGDSTDNYALVDDAGPNLDPADYVESNVVGATDQYTFTNLGHSPSAITGVQVSAYTSRTESGPRSLATIVNGVEGATIDPGAQNSIGSVYQTDPSTGSAWTKASIDALTAGIRIKA